jgi:hypothetical protein
MSAQTRLAEANRVLKRMEEDGPLLSKRVKDRSPEQRSLTLKLFAEALDKQRAYVSAVEVKTPAE